MKKLFALTCLTVLLLAPACCGRKPCGAEPVCEPVDQLAGSDQCVEICPPSPECRELCAPEVVCEEKEVPVKCFRKVKTCVVKTTGPMEFSCNDVEKPLDTCSLDAQDGENAVSTQDGVTVTEKGSRRGLRRNNRAVRRNNNGNVVRRTAEAA